MKRPYSTLKIKDDKYFIVADIHIGFEWEHIIKGVELPQDLSDTVTDDLLSAIEKENANKLILLGDIEHSWQSTFKHSLAKYEYFRLLKQKKIALTTFFSRLEDKFDNDSVIVIKGNHDISLGTEKIPLNFQIYSEYTLYKDNESILFAHGHKMPTQLTKNYYFAHIHPSVVLLDPTNVSYRMPVFLYIEIEEKKFIEAIKLKLPKKGQNTDDDNNNTVNIRIIPAFNRFITEKFGFPVNIEGRRFPRSKGIKSSNFINRIIKNGNVELFLTNGNYLGLLKDLKIEKNSNKIKTLD